MGDCGTLRDGSGKPFTCTNQVAAASFCTTPISTFYVFIDVLETWHHSWDIRYCECNQERVTTVEVCEPMRRCESRGFDAPPQGPGPQLFIQAPSQYNSITVGQYVQEALPWLRSLEDLIRGAAVVGDHVDSIEELLSFEYDLIPVPLVDNVQIFYNEPRYGLQLLESMKRRRAKLITQRQEQLGLQKAMEATAVSQ